MKNIDNVTQNVDTIIKSLDSDNDLNNDNIEDSSININKSKKTQSLQLKWILIGIVIFNIVMLIVKSLGSTTSKPSYLPDNIDNSITYNTLLTSSWIIQSITTFMWVYDPSWHSFRVWGDQYSYQALYKEYPKLLTNILNKEGEYTVSYKTLPESNIRYVVKMFKSSPKTWINNVPKTIVTPFVNFSLSIGDIKNITIIPSDNVSIYDYDNNNKALSYDVNDTNKILNNIEDYIIVWVYWKMVWTDVYAQSYIISKSDSVRNTIEKYRKEANDYFQQKIQYLQQDEKLSKEWKTEERKKLITSITGITSDSVEEWSKKVNDFFINKLKDVDDRYIKEFNLEYLKNLDILWL